MLSVMMSFSIDQGLAPMAFLTPNSRGSLLYGDEHDVAYAHDAAQQSEQTYYPEGSLHDGDSLVHLDIVHVSVPEPDGAIVIRCSLVVVVDAGTIVLLKLLVIFLGLQILDGELQTSCIIALA